MDFIKLIIYAIIIGCALVALNEIDTQQNYDLERNYMLAEIMDNG